MMILPRILFGLLQDMYARFNAIPAAATTGGCIKRPFDPFEGRPIDPPDMERIDK